MSTPVRTYGGWRERRGFGIGSLSGPQTAAGLTAVLMALGIVMVAPAALPVLAVPAVLGAAVVMLRVRGESVAALAGRHLRWRVRLRRGATAYRALDTDTLPGVLRGIEAATQVPGGPAVLADRRRLTMVVPVEPQGPEFMDPQTLADWVTGWGQWLAHLGYLPALTHVAVTVDSRPCGIRQPPREPSPVADLMAEIGAQQGAEHLTRTLISLTVDATGQPHDTAHRRLLEAVESVSALERCGMTVLAPLTEQDLAWWVRDCHEPTAVASGMAAGWSDARPTATAEHWNAYQHEAGWSAAFFWDEGPQSLGPQVLTSLFEPAGYAKRVTVVYVPVPAHAAAREVDRQAQAAVFRSQYRRRLGRDETARDRLDVERAHQTAQEQAHGSGLVDVGLYAVATASDPAALEEAAADLHNRAGQARLRLRRAYGEQAAVFAATLGLGYVPGRGW
jgi:hypothetical protein